ncbi:MAG: DoxX family membrane protein [Pseudomonadota bacterium]|nr:DoxX family membrane protein [Pseudomonadota bacterium]
MTGAMIVLNAIRRLHDGFFGAIERLAGNWFTGLAARFVFAAVLFVYFYNSWTTKVGTGFPGMLQPQITAYYQIVPWAAGGELGLFDHLVVLAGTWAELALPVLIVAGLFTRVAALGMIAFIAVQTFVDVSFHGVDAETIGAWFDRFPGAVIADQRLLWLFLLSILVIRGGGAVSLDGLLSRLPGGATRH